MTRPALIEHLSDNAVRTDGPFTLRSGEISNWYLDARQTTFDGVGGRLVGQTVLALLDADVQAVGGLTMGADPVAMATAIAAADSGRPLCAFSIRKTTKRHGTGGRLVGPVSKGMKVAILDDTTTTGSAAAEACDVAVDEGLQIVQAMALVDRSNGLAAKRFAERGVPFTAVLTPEDLGFST